MAVGFLHPGEMGASLGASCRAPARWCADGRSEETRARAERAGMAATETLGGLLETCEVVVSVCPPGAAEAVAERVAAHGFGGIYADVNAIAPSTARRIGARFDRFVDGGIIGPPVRAGATRLYLSGDDPAAVSELVGAWRGTDLEVRTVDGGPGAASALKSCFASWTKGTSALMLAIRALARAEGVDESILAEWATSMPDLVGRADAVAANAAPKAWRFVDEMYEHARAFADAGLPDGFGRGAAEVYERLVDLENVRGVALDEVLDRLRGDR